jgi:hypothetical protein
MIEPEDGQRAEFRKIARLTFLISNHVTSDHRVAGSSPAGCKLLGVKELRLYIAKKNRQQNSLLANCYPVFEPKVPDVTRD